MEKMTDQGKLITVKVKYISDIQSIFFKKGEVYEGFIPKDDNRFIAFHLDDYDESGDYALPIDRFEIIDSTDKSND